jgi:restriction system protein
MVKRLPLQRPSMKGGSLPDTYPPLRLTPEEFELTIKAWLDAAGVRLTNYESLHREIIPAEDGNYEIDITCRFSALGAEYLTLIECKYYKSRVKREQIQVLLTKMRSIGAQKAIMFATSGYQKGAVTFAGRHGVALVLVSDGRTSWMTRDANTAQIPWNRVPDFIPRVVGWLIGEAADSFSLISVDHPERLRERLRL